MLKSKKKQDFHLITFSIYIYLGLYKSPVTCEKFNTTGKALFKFDSLSIF